MISTSIDDYLVDLYERQSHWEVVLNNEMTVYSDDGRPETYDPAWKRLRKYCILNNLYITNFILKNRDHVEGIPSNKDGYYFSFGAAGSWGSPTIHQFVTGWIEENKLKILKWRVPELIIVTEEDRELDVNDERLILKNEIFIRSNKRNN